MNTIERELKHENEKLTMVARGSRWARPDLIKGSTHLAKTVFNIDFNNLSFEDRFGLALTTFGAVKEVESFCNKFNELNVDLTLTEEPDIWILEASA